MQGLMHGKRGLIMGVANDHSIAWGIARALAAHEAKLAFTYQGDALGKRVKPLAASVGADLVLPCDVEDLASVDTVFAELEKRLGNARFRRPRHRFFRQEPAHRPLCRHDARKLFAHDADLLLLVHRSGQARRRHDAEWRRHAHAYLQRRLARDAELQRHGRRQGGPRSVGALSRRRLRQRAASASTPSHPDPSARWPVPASATRAPCSHSSNGIRRCIAG